MTSDPLSFAEKVLAGIAIFVIVLVIWLVCYGIYTYFSNDTEKVAQEYYVQCLSENNKKSDCIKGREFIRNGSGSKPAEAYPLFIPIVTNFGR